MFSETVNRFSERDEEFEFFDAREDAISDHSSVSDNDDALNDCSTTGFDYQNWIHIPSSVQERRSKFLDWMGLHNERTAEDSVKHASIKENSRLVDDSILPSSTSFSPSYNLEERQLMGEEDTQTRIETEQVSSSSPETESKSYQKSCYRRMRKGWLRRLRPYTCIVSPKLGKSDDSPMHPSRVQRVKVHHGRKKELTALYLGQEIQGHEGSIFTMKFNHDGCYLASAGEDKIIRVWKVVEDVRSADSHILSIESSCIYFDANSPSEVVQKQLDRREKFQQMRRTPNSACVILPPKVFRILDKAIWQFHGHSEGILDISWSIENLLVSASIDKTVRLWRIGFQNCLQIFRHGDYVTCVDFNPVDEKYFISGSIDGKVRIWEIIHGQLVDWAETREIITAVCYYPDGQGCVVGTMRGNCGFYKISDNELQLGEQILLHSKKNSRITNMQFIPQDSSKLMVTSSNNCVRILRGCAVINKHKCSRNGKSQIYSSVTNDGKRIMSVCEDGDVYIQNYIEHGGKNKRSLEHFSARALVAIPWSGFSSFHRSGSTPLFSTFLDSLPSKNSATWPEERLIESGKGKMLSPVGKCEYKFVKESFQSACISHAWGLAIVTAGCDGFIRSFHNYGLPVD